MSNLKLVCGALADIECPRFSDSIWVPPFELLMGAAYALLAAERHGYACRDERKHEYHPHAREHIAAMLAEPNSPYAAAERLLLEDWVSGFYFNAAEHRLVWAGEHLIEAFATMDCTCGRHGELPVQRKHSLAELCRAASVRLDHIGADHQQDLTYVAVLLKQSAPKRQRPGEMAFNADKIFSMLREHLERHVYALDRQRATAAGMHTSWSSANPGVRLDCACAGFALLCHAYNEMIHWDARARDRVLTALGELA